MDLLGECRPKLEPHPIQHACWHFIVRPPKEQPSRQVFPHTAPLLEEERNLSLPALSEDLLHPLPLHRACTWPRLSADNHPVDPDQRQAGQWPDERFTGQEPDGHWDAGQVVDPGDDTAIFYANPHPDVARPRQVSREVAQTGAALR